MIVNSIKLSNVVFNKTMGIGSIALRIMDPPRYINMYHWHPTTYITPLVRISIISSKVSGFL